MPGYHDGFGERQFDAMLAAVQGLVRSGPFTAYDVLYAVLGPDVTEEIGDVTTFLEDLEDLEVLRRVPPVDGRPPMWMASGPA